MNKVLSQNVQEVKSKGMQSKREDKHTNTKKTIKLSVSQDKKQYL